MDAVHVKKKARKESEHRKEELEETYKRLRDVEFEAIYMERRESRYTGGQRDVLKVQPSSLNCKMIKALDEIYRELQFDSSTWKGIRKTEGEYTLWIEPIQQLKLYEEYTFRVNSCEVIDSLNWKNPDYKTLVNIDVEVLPEPSMTYPPPLKTHDRPFEYLRGTELASQTSFLITGKPESLEWKGYGFWLHVPAGCIPTTKADFGIHLNVGVSLSGQYKLPPGTQLVSAVYWLQSPIKLEEPVVLEVEHSISLKDPRDCSELSFVITQCNQAELPYQFRLLEGGTFSQSSAIGSISRSKFSGFAIIKKLWRRISSGSELVERYCGQQLYQRSPSDWTIHFVVTKNLQAQLTAVQKHLPSASTVSGQFTFEFESDDLSLNIEREGTLLDSGWKIIPMYPPKISKLEVDSFTSGKVIPRFELKLRWTLKNQPPVCLDHSLTLHGAKGDVYFTICISPEAVSGWEPSLPSMSRTSSSLSEPSSSGEASVPSLSRASSSGNEHGLGLQSSPSLHQFLEEVAVEIPDKLFDFGVQLRIRHEQLKALEISHHCTTQRFAQIYSICKDSNIQLTWSIIIEVLKTKSVAKKKLADELSKKYA